MKKILAPLVVVLLSLNAQGALAAAIPAAPDLAVKAYALLDYSSGQLLAGKEADMRVEPASITKVMTVYIALDEMKQGRIKPDDDVLISERAWRQGKDSTESRMFVEVGKQVKFMDLLRGIIIQSGNDATVAVSEHIAGSEDVFAELMNQYAKKLGLKNSHFADASGMPNPEHYTTAHDLTLLGRALIRDFPEAYKIFSEREFVFHGIRQGNRNLLLDMDPSVDGIKTGHTEAAGYCLLSSAMKDGRRLIAAVMGDVSTKERANNSRALLGYGFRFFETVPMFGPGQPAGVIQVWKGNGQKLPVGVQNQIALTLPRGSRAQLKIATQVDKAVIAPVQAGQQLGTVSVLLDGKPIRTEPLVALQAMPEGGLWQRLVDSVRLMLQ
jgi:D-alanyl-D-alanine carboxypeptidase (penicillin-binding protein 5/6)